MTPQPGDYSIIDHQPRPALVLTGLPGRVRVVTARGAVHDRAQRSWRRAGRPFPGVRAPILAARRASPLSPPWCSVELPRSAGGPPARHAGGTPALRGSSTEHPTGERGARGYTARFDARTHPQRLPEVPRPRTVLKLSALGLRTRLPEQSLQADSSRNEVGRRTPGPPVAVQALHERLRLLLEQALAHGPRLLLEFGPAAVDEADEGFHRGAAGGPVPPLFQLLAEDGEVVVVAQEVAQGVGLVRQLVEDGGPERVKHQELVPQVLGLLAPLVQVLHRRVGLRRRTGVAALPVDLPEAGAQHRPAPPADRPPLRPPPRRRQGLPDRPQGVPLPQHAPPDLALVVPQPPPYLAQRLQVYLAGEGLGQLVERVHEDLGVADLRQRPGRVAQGGVLLPVGAFAQRRPQQAQQRPRLLHPLAGVVDRCVGERPAPAAQRLQRLAHLLAQQAADALGSRFLWPQLLGHRRPPLAGGAARACPHMRQVKE